MSYTNIYKNKTFKDGEDAIPAGAMNEALQNTYNFERLFTTTSDNVIKLGNYKISFGRVSVASTRDGSARIEFTRDQTFVNAPYVIVTPELENWGNAFIGGGVFNISNSAFSYRWYGNGTNDKVASLYWIAIGY
ncbi:MAG: hypothetical protein KBS91_03940 [Firmicutes bacterium]|nr:hypothetical protein [Candidatus Caballimonas caccae]